MTVSLMIILFLAVVLVVMAYNLYQEHSYRRQIRHQFGHSDHDALLGSQTQSVRDGQYLGGNRLKDKAEIIDQTPSTQQPATESSLSSAELLAEEPAQQPASLENATSTSTETVAAETPAAEAMPDLIIGDSEPAAEIATPEQPAHAQSELQFEEPAIISDDKHTSSRRVLMPLDDLAHFHLSWFDARFDYLAYISLYQPKELQALPRLTSGHRFQIIGCTMDGRFQVAEPIPGVHYQAFVIGLQAISRSGLASMDELLHFKQQVQRFADKMDGQTAYHDVDKFMQNAIPLDEFCVRVDQTIAIHLVSSSSISGIELRNEVEKAGFILQDEGYFTSFSSTGDPEYVLTSLSGTPFTAALLAHQPYKGFSLLFDITRIADGEDKFNQFMALAVRLSSNLNLQLVDDQVQQLSTEWLREVRNYVCERQLEMLRVDIEPGSALAKRLFS